jgi:prepilin-type N-terminal cleavage/methylation domain-containing protein
MRHQIRGFSLVEMLVTIAIIAILLGLLMTSIVAVRARAEALVEAGQGDMTAFRGVMMQRGNGGNLDAVPTSAPKQDALGVTVAELTGQSTNTIWIYKGIFYDEDGSVSFRENIDDKARLIIDGTTVIDNTGWNQASSSGALSLSDGPFDNAPGWHEFEFRMVNNGGGGLRVGGLGFGWDPTGNAGGSTNEGDYEIMENTSGKYDVFLALSAEEVAALGEEGIPKQEDLKEGGEVYQYQAYQDDSIEKAKAAQSGGGSVNTGLQ